MSEFSSLFQSTQHARLLTQGWRERKEKSSNSMHTSYRESQVIGTQAAVDQVLAACGWLINTSFVERLNLSLRQRVVAIRRRSASPCKSGDGLSHQLALFHAYHNFVLPHASLRQPLPVSEATHGKGSAKQWRPCTPAMAAGPTDHVWSLREVLMFRVPPWPQPQTV